MERSGTEVSSAPPTNPAGIRVGGSTIPQARGGGTRPADPTPIPAERPSGDGVRTGSTVRDTVRSTARSEVAVQPGTAGRSADGSADGSADRSTVEGRRKRHWLGLTLTAIACCTVGATIGGALAVADHQASKQQAQLAPLLAQAALDVQQVNAAGQPLNPARLIDLLQKVQSSDAAVAGLTTGRSWLIATTVTRHDSLEQIADEAEGLSLLAAAAGPLRDSLATLQLPGASDPDRLDALARDLNRFASVSLRAQQLGTYPAPNDAAGTPFEQLATAAAVLPTMAGSEAPRAWTSCPPSTGACYRFTVDAGRVVGRGRMVDRRIAVSTASDIVVYGRAPRDLVQDGRIDVQALLKILVSMDSTEAGADDGSPVVTSSVPVEQHALDVIAKQGTRS